MARKSAVERRRELIEAGLTVIAREGMHGATVRAIVAEADVPLATFHYVFASRDEMIGEAYAYIALRPDEDATDAVPEGATLEQAVEAIITLWFERFTEHPEFELAIMEIMAYCNRTPALAHLPAQVQERYLEAIVGTVEAVRAAFGVSSDMSAKDVAGLVVHLTDGLTYGWLRTRDTAASRSVIRAAVPVIADALGRA